MADVQDAPWAGRGDTRLNALERVQRGLTVEMIMTPRDRLMTCQRDDNSRKVVDRNTERYSYLPVVDGNSRILGLYQAERWFEEEAPDQPIGDDFEPFSEDLVIGANASIIDFVRAADDRSTRLVVSGRQVAGLIGLSDLQQLPVRAALFTLITSLEMAMADRITAEWPDSADDWLKLLNDKQRREVCKNIREAKQYDGFVSEIVHTQLADKGTIIRKKELIPISKTKLRRHFTEICNLRNQVAHANDYALTRYSAHKVCSVTRSMIEILVLLHDATQKKREPSTSTTQDL